MTMMTTLNNATEALQRAADGSAAARAVRPIIEGSVLCAAVVSVIRWLRRTREPIVVGLGGRWTNEEAIRASERVDAVASESRAIGVLAAMLAATAVARREAAARRLLNPLLGVDLLERVRVFGVIVIAAVVTHAVLLAVLGVSVHQIGWIIRACLAAAGVMLIRWPEPIAAAWKDRTA